MKGTVIYMYYERFAACVVHSILRNHRVLWILSAFDNFRCQVPIAAYSKLSESAYLKMSKYERKIFNETQMARAIKDHENDSGPDTSLFILPYFEVLNTL
jgi:hypothetical protein